MSRKDNQKPSDPNAEQQRAEHEFDIITFVLASVLALIVLGAVGYGVFNSSQVTHTIPSPNDVSRAVIKAVTQPATDGSAAPHREAGKNR